jgi:hypothetical protein
MMVMATCKNKEEKTKVKNKKKKRGECQKLSLKVVELQEIFLIKKMGREARGV